MKTYLLISFLLSLFLASCQIKSTNTDYSDVQIAGAMKNVMRQGDLSDKIQLDTILEDGLYGLGPLSQLRGEILVKNGIAYVSQVQGDASMLVRKDTKATAPFLVYSRVQQWKQLELPTEIKHINQLQTYIDSISHNLKRPFAFRLKGHVQEALIHVQNLPPGTKISSPKEAHQGQTDYSLKDQDCEIVGFFSTQHQGIFTHHDSYLHMHLITNNESMMGHLDQANFGNMKLYIPLF